MLKQSEIWLIGAGVMAKDYAKVLSAQSTSFQVIGRSQKTAQEFENITGHKVFVGGLKSALESLPPPKAAIVAVAIPDLASVSATLIEAGIKSILVEKPAGLNTTEIRSLANLASRSGAEVKVAYNRRYYSSVLVAQKIINDDGGIKSFHFEFTEWNHLIEALKNHSPETKDQWILANSSHVIDLAFYLGGQPERWSAYSSGGLSWHPKASIFTGAGTTAQGALFSYQANWESPGRWSVELLTSKHRLIFRPLEQLHVQKHGSVEITKVDVDDRLDKEFKPGLYLQTQAFLTGNHKEHLCSLIEHAAKVEKIYEKLIERSI